eukprot:442998_1
MSILLQANAYGFIDACSWFICSFMLLLTIIFHSLKMYQDLFTKDRLSLSHRVQKPPINNVYIMTTISAFVSILMYFLSLTIGNIGHFSFLSESCRFVGITSSISWQIAKCGLYLVFLLRLHTVYRKSQYKYNPKTLLCIGIVTILTNVLVMIFLGLFVYSDGYYVYSFSSTITICKIIIPEWLLYLSATYDIIMNCFCLFAFIYPLKKLLEQIPTSRERSTSVHIQPRVARLVTVGLKFVIVTTTAVLSTLLMIIIIAMTDALVVGSYDMVINSVCILLMVPYYNDKLYYNRLCYGCIYCCTNCKYNGIHSKFKIVTQDLSVSSASNMNSSNSKTSTIEIQVT